MGIADEKTNKCMPEYLLTTCFGSTDGCSKNMYRCIAIIRLSAEFETKAHSGITKENTAMLLINSLL